MFKTHWFLAGFAALAFSLSASVGHAQNESAVTLEIQVETISDFKAVYATVQSQDVIAARARIGGTIATLNVDDGDNVEGGSTLAVVIDDRLAPQVRALDAQVAATTAELRQAQSDLDRARQLFDRGVIAQARLDEASTHVDIVTGQLNVVRQERSVLIQQQQEGEVLAPMTGVVLNVMVTEGTVVFAGEPIANVASENYVLRLRLPERHARFMAEGEAVRIDQSALSETTSDMISETGIISQIYPEIIDGRVVADAEVEGLGEFLVGERVRVWVSAGQRQAILVPGDYIHTRYGVDFVTLLSGDGGHHEMIVQRGRGGDEGRVEILGGLVAGDVIVAP